MRRLFISFLVLIFLNSCNTSLSDKEVEVYQEKGLLIARSTGSELSTTLTNKMKSGGLVEAVEFCNTTALPITKQMSDSYGVTIKRTSLKTRNSLNKPSEDEILILKEFQVNLDKDIPLEPVVQLDQKGDPNYYAPILVEKKCLICHGTLDRELSRSADSIIKSYYPNDLATAYQEGELRGMWSISFPQQTP
jgi:hypothetical protein